MVDCDTKNRDKIKKKCEMQRLRIKDLAMKLRLARSPEEVSEDLSLVEQNRRLALLLKTLEDKMEDIMANFRYVSPTVIVCELQFLGRLMVCC